jgi:hypothetical protein
MMVKVKSKDGDLEFSSGDSPIIIAFDAGELNALRQLAPDAGRMLFYNKRALSGRKALRMLRDDGFGRK